MSYHGSLGVYFKTHQIFNINTYDNNFLFLVSKDLVKKKHKVDRIVYDIFDFNSVIALPCDYYKINKKVSLNLKNLKQIKHFEKKINSQLSFEEIITEALATIMVFTRNSDFINYEELNEYSFDDDVFVGIKVIESFDKDILRWFLLSTYDEVYYDKFEKYFNNYYTRLLKIMYKIYELDLSLTDDMNRELTKILKINKTKTYFK